MVCRVGALEGLGCRVEGFRGLGALGLVRLGAWGLGLGGVWAMLLVCSFWAG